MSSSSRGEFLDLIEAMSSGSEEAAWRLTETYTPHIMRAVRAALPKAIRSKLDSIDCVQAVWASILLRRERLDQFVTPEQFIGYLVTIARNQIIDMQRHYSAQKRDVHNEIATSRLERHSPGYETEGELHLQSYDPTPSQVSIARETWDKLMSQNSDRDKMIVSLRIQGRTYADISERLQVSEKTVQRTMERLLDQFSNEK